MNGETEEDYLDRWVEEVGKNLRLVVRQADGTNPEKIVSSAIKLSKTYPGETPLVWCVGDRDDWNVQELHDQMQRASAKKIQYLLSVPCFELWIVLHFERYDKSEHRTVIQSKSDGWLPSGDPRQSKKRLNPKQVEILFEKYPIAIKNAKWIHNSNTTGGKDFPEDPRSDMWKLIEFLTI